MTSGDPFADYLLRDAVRERQDFRKLSGLPAARLTGSIQDDWRLTSNLTVNPVSGTTTAIRGSEKYDRFGGIYARISQVFRSRYLSRLERTAGPAALSIPTRNNFAPRLGLAYRPGGSNRTAIRVGYGVFYNKDIGNTIVDFVRNYPFTVRERRITGSVNVDSPPYAAGRSVPVRTALSQTQGIFGQRTPSTPDAIMQNWNLTLQRLFLRDLAVEVAYVGSTGRKLPFGFSKNIAPPVPETSSAAAVAQHRAVPVCGSVFELFLSLVPG